MNTAALFTAITALLQPIPAIGQVWDRKRFHVPAERHREVWGITDPDNDRGWSVRVWHCYRMGFTAQFRDVGNAITSWVHHVRLVGWWEIDDAGDSTAQYRNVLDALVVVFANQLALEAVASGFDAPSLVTESELAIAEKYDCHVLELAMDVRQRRNILADEEVLLPTGGYSTGSLT